MRGIIMFCISSGCFFFFNYFFILFCRIQHMCLTPTSCNDALVPITRALCFVEKGD